MIQRPDVAANLQRAGEFDRLSSRGVVRSCCCCQECFAVFGNPDLADVAAGENQRRAADFSAILAETGAQHGVRGCVGGSIHCRVSQGKRPWPPVWCLMTRAGSRPATTNCNSV